MIGIYTVLGSDKSTVAFCLHSKLSRNSSRHGRNLASENRQMSLSPAVCYSQVWRGPRLICGRWYRFVHANVSFTNLPEVLQLKATLEVRIRMEYSVQFTCRP